MGHEDLDFFNENGYLKLGRIISSSLTTALQTRIDNIMMGRVMSNHFRYQLIYSENYEKSGEQETAGHKGATLDYRKIVGLEHDDLFRRLVVNPSVQSVISPLFDGDVSVYRAMFINKPAGSQEVLPWHQDVASAQRWDLDTDRAVFIWTALDDMKKSNGCLHILPGSHKRGAWHDDHFATDTDIADGHFEANQLVLEMEAGESVLLNNLLMHKSDVNTTDQPRRAFSVCYIDAATRNVKTGENYPVFIRGRN